jgi:hypothetical protein
MKGKRKKGDDFDRQGKWGENAADQIRAFARLRKWRRSSRASLPRAALADSLALGYYRPPLQGFQLAASPKVLNIVLSAKIGAICG